MKAFNHQPHASSNEAAKFVFQEHLFGFSSYRMNHHHHHRVFIFVASHLQFAHAYGANAQTAAFACTKLALGEPHRARKCSLLDSLLDGANRVGAKLARMERRRRRRVVVYVIYFFLSSPSHVSSNGRCVLPFTVFLNSQPRPLLNLLLLHIFSIERSYLSNLSLCVRRAIIEFSSTNTDNDKRDYFVQTQLSS